MSFRKNYIGPFFVRIPFSRFRDARAGHVHARRLPARDPLRTRAPFHARSRVNVRVKSARERERRRMERHEREAEEEAAVRRAERREEAAPCAIVVF